MRDLLSFVPLAVTLVLLVPATPLRAQDADRDALLRRALEEVNRGRFDAALGTAAELRRLFPDDPAGSLAAANAYQTLMRDHRRRDYEADFESTIAQAETLAEARALAAPTAEAFFALGTARGYRAVHRARRGGWLPALKEGRRALHDMEHALELDPGFADPLLSLGLYDYWKSRKLSLGIGLFAGRRRRAIERLETVWASGRYFSISAAYSLVAIYLQEGDLARAEQASGWLLERYPDNPVSLYYRALVLEKLRRPEAALAVWDEVARGLLAFERLSDGFLAECHLHRAQLYERLGNAAGARSALLLAARHARERDAAAEMEGPLEDFEAVRARIDRMIEDEGTQTANASGRPR